MTSPEAHPYGDDIYTEPDGDPDTLSNLGPLAPLAGIWLSADGKDEHPVVDGLGRDSFVERFELQPIDRQTNGPQLFYGLRYHTHIVKPDEIGPSMTRWAIGSGSRRPTASPSHWRSHGARS